MSPLKIEICLHYHSSVTDHPWIDSDSPAVPDTMHALINDGLLLDGAGRRYIPTQKLHAFVAMLENTPLPDNCWVDPRTGKKLEGLGINSQ